MPNTHQKFCFDNLPQINKTSPELENSNRIMLGWVGGWGWRGVTTW